MNVNGPTAHDDTLVVTIKENDERLQFSHGLHTFVSYSTKKYLNVNIFF